jgi:hypothetical protein
MKLTYKISKTTELGSETIINRILLKIQERKYGLLTVTDNSVSFDENTGGLIGNWEYSRRLYSGRFDVMSEKNGNIVVFEYCPIPLSEFIFVGIACAIFIILGIINAFYFSGIISAIFLALLTFKHYNLKRVAGEMLAEILT